MSEFFHYQKITFTVNLMNTKGILNLYTRYFLCKPGTHNFYINTSAQFQSFELIALKKGKFFKHLPFTSASLKPHHMFVPIYLLKHRQLFACWFLMCHILLFWKLNVKLSFKNSIAKVYLFIKNYEAVWYNNGQPGRAQQRRPKLTLRGKGVK